eukprot:TRINITY_DN91776_c0_g1_i1.p1 TRINITY_DN91776_c0_g1~~TRINITY_DN91776_c0_g1_i1.p1  ORF type:complete len:632 (+),score=108.65 TRINITY_DN91776_c0_g1_i1:34-1896(+)
MATAERRLYEIVAPRRYLESDNHPLNYYVQEIRQAVASGAGDPDDLLDHLEKELEGEQESLARAFKLFDNRGRGQLSNADIKNMNRYLGFPSDDGDVDALVAMIDSDKSGSISFPEFEEYVGRMGGSQKLFEERHKRIKDKLGYEVAAEDTEAICAALDCAGINREAQSYWKMVVPPSEFREAAKLTTYQQNAVRHIRLLAKKNHEEALPRLQQRVTRLGFKEDDLWLTLAWIRELAPVIVHLNLDKMLQFMERDTHYRNQFETASSGGLLKPAVREKWERDLFGGCYDRASGFERPKYGVQNVMNDPRGVVKCAQYGDSYCILKDARLRCTFSPEDSANLKADKLAVLDFYGHVLSNYDDNELTETIKVANSADAALLGDSGKVGNMKYKEAQIHGEIAFAKHVERLVAHTRHRGKAEDSRIKAMCERHGIAFSWMDEERERMRHESMHKLGGGDWKERLQRLQEDGGDLDVPEGYCKVGCGRQVAPGVTRAGRPFTTCCRGCIMGFGHDQRCGRIDASKVGPGLCKNGCGLKVAPGTDAKGRPLTTCCRGCAMGMAHDKQCQKAPSAPSAAPVAPGMCKVGCGRAVAPGATRSGKAFDTCCRDCPKSHGADHSSGCIG